MKITVLSIDGKPELFFLPKQTVRRIMRDSLWNSVVASSAIEEIDLSDQEPPDPKTIPTSLLTTD